MASFISTFIIVGICLAIYAYIKRKYSSQIQALENQISSLNLELIRSNTRMRELDTQLFVKNRELSTTKSKLDTMNDINKDLVTAKKQIVTTEAPKKRGRKPGTKKPYYKKKSGGNPS